MKFTRLLVIKSNGRSGAPALQVLNWIFVFYAAKLNFTRSHNVRQSPAIPAVSSGTVCSFQPIKRSGHPARFISLKRNIMKLGVSKLKSVVAGISVAVGIIKPYILTCQLIEFHFIDHILTCVCPLLGSHILDLFGDQKIAADTH